MGADFPQTKTVFLRAATHFFRLSDPDFLFDPQYIRAMLPISSAHCPNFPPPIFSKTLRKISPKSLLKTKGYLKCVNLYFGPDLTTRFSRKLPRVLKVFLVWGQNPTRQPGIRPPVFLAPRRRQHRPARAATGQGHVAGQRGPFGRRHGGQKPYFRFDRAGSSILCNSLAE